MTSLHDWVGEAIPDVVMDDAAAWLSVLDSDNCQVSDRLAFARWLDTDPRHRLAFEELSEVWARLQILTDVPAMLDHPDVIRFSADGGSRGARAATPVRFRSDWSAAIAVALVVVGSMLHIALGGPSQTFSTTQGETAAISLSDGSTAELNVETRLEVRIDEQRRDIKLLAGEAVFHVAKDKRPFLVVTDQGTIAALGTSFAVDTTDGILQVSVLEGLVSVTAGQSKVPLTEFDGMTSLQFTDETERVSAGERLEISGSLKRYPTVTDLAFTSDLAWRDGYVIFDEQSLQSVVADMRKYADLHIHLASPELNTLRISGRFATTDTDGFLQLLRDKYGLNVDHVNGDFVVLRQAPIPLAKN